MGERREGLREGEEKKHATRVITKGKKRKEAE